MAGYTPGDLSSLFSGSTPTGSSKKSSKSKKRKQADNASSDLSSLFAGAPQSQDKSSKKRKSEKLKSSGSEANEETVKVKEEEDTVANQAVADNVEETIRDEKDKRTVFIGNVPVSSEVKQKVLLKLLRQHFSEYGKIESIRLRSVAINKSKIKSSDNYKVMKKVSVIKNNLQADSSCNAYVVFAEYSSAEKLLKHASNNETVFQGNHLRIDSIVDVNKHYDRRYTVFIGNVPRESNEEEVRAYFEKQLQAKATNAPPNCVKSVKLIKDKITHENKGIGYVLLHDASTQMDALALENLVLHNRKLRVEQCVRSVTMKRPGSSNDTKLQPKRKFEGARARIMKKNNGKPRGKVKPGRAGASAGKKKKMGNKKPKLQAKAKSK